MINEWTAIYVDIAHERLYSNIKFHFTIHAHFVLLQSVLGCFPVPLDFFGEAPFMNFGWSVIYPESADFAENLLDDGLVCDTGATHYLNAAVGDAHQSLRNRHFRH